VICQSTQSTVCVKLTVLDEDVFVVFDPHPRMDHTNGPGFMLSTSRTTTASFINCMLDSPSTGLLEGGDIFLSLQSQFFTAHVLTPKDAYYRITAYQNEQMLRDTYLCAHEEALGTSVLYVNLWNQLLPPEVGPSESAASGSQVAGSSSSSSSSSNSSSSSSSSPRSLPLSTFLATPRFVSDTWQEDSAYHLIDSYSLMHKPALAKTIKTTFECAVCLEVHPIYSSVQLAGCEHPFCKECLQGHVRSFLSNGRFPIECPVCLLDRDVPDPGSESSISFTRAFKLTKVSDVTDAILSRLSMPLESMERFRELQALQHSVRLECPTYVCAPLDLLRLTCLQLHTIPSPPPQRLCPGQNSHLHLLELPNEMVQGLLEDYDRPKGQALMQGGQF